MAARIRASRVAMNPVSELATVSWTDLSSIVLNPMTPGLPDDNGVVIPAPEDVPEVEGPLFSSL